MEVRADVDPCDFEDLLLDLSVLFINLPADQIDPQVAQTQRRLCEFIDVDLSALWQWNPDDPGTFSLTHVYRRIDGPPIPDRLDARQNFPVCLERVTRGEIVVVSSQDELTAEWDTDRASWQQFGIVSSLVFPLVVGTQPPVGALSFDSMTAKRSWPDALVRRLALVAQVFANAIARKRADESLWETEQQLRLATEAGGTGAWSLDPRSRRYWVTPKTMELLGLPMDDVLTLDRFLELVHPDDRASIRRKIEELFDSGEEGQAEYRIVRPDGAVRWIASRGRVRSTSPDDPGRLRGVTVDITERRRLEEAARNLSGRLIAAHEQERARLARELHDDITQRLACAAVETAQIERMSTHGMVREALRSLRRDLSRTADDVHSLSYRLHPTVLNELGLAEAIKVECEQFRRMSGVSVELSLCEVPESTTPETCLCLFRVVQEALRNVARHADASGIEVIVSEHDGALELEVRDDGRGFDLANPAGRATLGLSGMRERVRHAGGRFLLNSTVGRGTSVIASVPLGRGRQ